MLKLRPKTEMAWAASGLALMSSGLLLLLILAIRPYFHFRQQAGQQVVVSPELYDDFLGFYRSLMFRAVPAMAVLAGVGAWTIFRHLKRIGDEPSALINKSLQATPDEAASEKPDDGVRRA